MHLKFRWWVPVRPHRLASEGNPDAEPLHIPEVVQGFCKMPVAIVGNPWPAKVLNVHLPEWPAWTKDLDSIRKPSNPHGCVGPLVIPVHDRVTDYLLEGDERIVGTTLFDVPGGYIDFHRYVSGQNLINPAKHFWKRSRNPFLVTDRIGQLQAVDPQKLKVGAADKLSWICPMVNIPTTVGTGGVSGVTKRNEAS